MRNISRFKAIPFPAGLTKECRDLLSGLVRNDPAERMDSDAFSNHKWFGGKLKANIVLGANDDMKTEPDDPFGDEVVSKALRPANGQSVQSALRGAQNDDPFGSIVESKAVRIAQPESKEPKKENKLQFEWDSERMGQDLVLSDDNLTV